jgi:hypothetical protein
LNREPDTPRGGLSFIEDPMERVVLIFTCVASALALLTAALQLAFGNPSLRALTALTALALAGVLGWSAQLLGGRSGLPDAVTLWLPLVVSGFVLLDARVRLRGAGGPLAAWFPCATVP